MKRYKYILIMGGLYRMTAKQYRGYLNALADGLGCEPEEFGGVLLGTPLDVTDMDEEDFKYLVDDI